MEILQVNQKEKFDEIQKLRGISIRGWDDIRDPTTYEYKNLEYPFGIRKVALPSERTKLLQASRGQSIGEDTNTYESYLEKYKKDSNEFHEFDKLRILEILVLQNENKISINSEKYFYEYGFRSTSVLSFWKKHLKNAKGCDVVSPCVSASQDLGFDTELIDLNVQVPNLKNVVLLAAFHVLEHLSDPLGLIKKTYASMEKNSIFHVEIPIEEDGPRIKYGHLFPFHPGDLYHMLSISGFQIINYTNRPFPGGPAIERAVAIKKD